MKRLLLILAVALPAFAQPVAYIATSGNQSLNSAAYLATLQQPATGGANVAFPRSTVGGSAAPGATVYCSAACVVTIYRNGAAATSTATVPNNVNAGQPPAVTNFYAGSNGGTSGATTLGVINVPAGATQQIDLSAVVLGTTGLTTTNLTLGIASVTATVNISFYFTEQH